MTEDDSRGRGGRSNPIGTMLGATFGPFGAAVGSVVSEDRFAFKFSVSTGAGADDGFDEANAATVEIEDGDDKETVEDADEVESSGDESAEADD